MPPDLPDLGLLLIVLMALAGVGILCLALMTVGGLMLARSLAERLPVNPEGIPLPRRRTTEARTRTTRSETRITPSAGRAG